MNQQAPDQHQPTFDIDQLSHQIEQSLNSQDPSASKKSTRQIPPLEKWHPNLSGTMNVVVKANGDWWHEGRQITRQALIDLFAKVLWSEVDSHNQIHYFLKTPVEKWQIHVEDAPLLVNQVDVIEQPVGNTSKTVLQFTTTQGDVVIADEAHPIRLGLPFTNATNDDALKQKQASQPYLLVRQNGDSALYGLIHRNVFYHLIDLGELIDSEAGTSLVLHSGDRTFKLTMTA